MLCVCVCLGRVAHSVVGWLRKGEIAAGGRAVSASVGAMQVWMGVALEKAVPFIRETIARVAREDDKGMKAAGAAIKKNLLSLGLAKVELLQLVHILVHPEKRFSTRLDLCDVHSIWDDLTDVGLDWELI